MELSSHEINFMKTPTNVYATLYNICNRRAVTIQTNNARAPYSRTTHCSSAPSFNKLYISCWVCTSLLQAPIISTVTGALNG